jgi:hypothetical protein
MHVTFTLAEDLMALMYALPEGQPMTTGLARYLLSVTQAVAEGHPLTVTSTCTECGKTPDVGDEEHLCLLMPDGRTAVVVGCDGYWLIDPASVGLFGTNWQPPRGMPLAVPVDDRPRQNEPGA